ncbi:MULTISPECIES: tRNA 2-selenouridine(34) synthase MnmH [Dyadobacter]|uniref:tRNA 2-selenouridine(34) synthase MnmH n=1 Tax=Dyadobacter psychrotolerans TaxID=2541721 RepID=A0A4R5DR80_9BACT|nr:tRNA 2-selenouridine(34) synthase MnmH [Dyadobacter psychrotolerans]TDE13303.1 tRNA 2-selenouridine(34) synthase MnmH [Dyadobacter psychrotolerans]
MIENITIDEFLDLTGVIALVDLRTPAEFAHGHIPGAFNIPLFSNEERVLVGTTYKQVGREQAILLGFDLTGPKWSDFIRQALVIAPGKKIAVHCWRGGMRSGTMAWALNLYGFKVYLIEGGYKSYRRWAHRLFAKRRLVRILGGMTGSGKTKLLHELRKMGEQVIDLEDLARHQGSSYGTMNSMIQPSQEQFENNLAEQLNDLNLSRPTWIEDENLNIGKLSIPRPFWEQMKNATLINLEIAPDQRVRELVVDYGELDKDFLVICTERIRKRLGPVQTTQAVAAIRENRMADFIRLVLVYYDKTYRSSLQKRDVNRLFTLELAGEDKSENAKRILNFASSIAETRQEL